MLNRNVIPPDAFNDVAHTAISKASLVDRRPGFACVTLRKNPKPSLLFLSMRGELRNAIRNKPAESARDSAPGNLFLRTKLLPPRPAPEILARPRLTERLQSNLSLPVTLVTANAGSGKTTLVADFLRKQEHPYVWYQLDHTDADPAVFLGYLTFGIQQRYENFGETTLGYLQQAHHLARYPERAADVLLNELLERIEQQLILVLDDYHHLGAETPVHAVLDRLIAYLPDVIHLIIISREAPPLALARLRAQDSLAIVDRADLLFTNEETQELFRRVFGLALTTEQLREYGTRTHGWITALQLVRQVAQRQVDQQGAIDPLSVLHKGERDIFEYFAEEVFAAETGEIQQYLMRIALLERIDLETCAQLFPEIISSAMLPVLVRRNVFITVAADAASEEYRLHPLFQSFLRRRLRSDVGIAGVQAEHVRLAEYFLKNNAWEQAVRHLLEAEDYDRAAELIAARGNAWIASGKLASLAGLSEAVPSAVLEAHPRALAFRAEVARLRGEFDAAQKLFRRAVKSLREKNDGEGEAEALHSLATIARRHGEFQSAFEYLDRAVELTDSSSVVRRKCGNTRGLCLAAMGDWTSAEREFRIALQSADEQCDEHHIRLITHNLGLPGMMRGDFGEALRWLHRMLRTDSGEAPIPQEATAHLNIARCHLYRGELSESEQHLDQALERCQLFNLVGPLGEAFEAYGNLWRERGELTRAVEFYQRAARTYSQAGIDLGGVELLEEQAFLNLKAGDVGRARTEIERLVELRRDKSEIGRFTAGLARGRILLEQSEIEEARRELSSAAEYFHQHGLYYYEAQASMALAVCDFKSDQEPQMLDRLRRALDLAARYDYEYWLRQEVLTHREVFASEDARELLTADLRAELEIAPQSQAEIAKVPTTVLTSASVVDLTINLLGPVDIFRDLAKPFAADAWTTRRARDILCFIASRRHRRTSKDTIIDTFWRDSDIKAIEKNFHPTMSHIRKALNSNQPLKQNFLIYRDGDYQLNPEFSYRVDIEQFDHLIADGEAANREADFDRCIAAYEQAVTLYRGEYMHGTYDEWVDEQRSYYREQYLHMLESLAALSEKKQDWSRSLNLAQRIIHEDPFREDIHCLLMRAYAALGNRVAVKEQYEALRKLLKKELGVEPAMSTQKLFATLLGNE